MTTTARATRATPSLKNPLSPDHLYRNQTAATHPTIATIQSHCHSGGGYRTVSCGTGISQRGSRSGEGVFFGFSGADDIRNPFLKQEFSLTLTPVWLARQLPALSVLSTRHSSCPDAHPWLRPRIACVPRGPNSVRELRVVRGSRIGPPRRGQAAADGLGGRGTTGPDRTCCRASASPPSVALTPSPPAKSPQPAPVPSARGRPRGTSPRAGASRRPPGAGRGNAHHRGTLALGSPGSGSHAGVW
jgi:hypothetical protein